jgi:hypothetical protein
MIITFDELGIKDTDYQGGRSARSEIINATCDYIMAHFFPGQNEMDCIFNAEFAYISHMEGVVYIETSPIRTH